MNTRALLAPPPGKTAGRARWPLRVGRALALGLLALAAPLAEAETNALKDIEFAALPGDRVRITLVLESEAPEPLSFTIDNPARIALDFPATRNALEKKSRTIGVGVAQSISTAEANNRTRVVVNLVQLAPYETRVEGNKVHVLLEHPTGAEGRARAAAAEAGPGPAARGGDRNGHRVVGVDFRRTEEGAGQVIVELSDPTAPVDVRQEGERLLVDFKNTSLPQKLERRLDVVDFATPVNTVETFAHGSDTRMVVHPTGEYEHLAYQSERVFTLEVKPLTKEEKEAREKEEFEYTGERLSLNFQDIEVRSVLQLLADFTGLNIVVSDSVQGSLTLRLKNVPWDQALDIILKTKGLDMRQTGNVILVAPTEEIA
ncbi:MAG: AMIN domain-containing protein, partial [Gammaproteobacteria bacterium]|nr:AMIN domain-containing protein [Gammaproteobacteria bacterium]NIR59125.1 AMIN domain-containing protein [Gammaproteobacteria bacterium]